MKDPEVIWLQPWCADCERFHIIERQWHDENCWPDGCIACKAQPVKYVKAES